MKTRTGRAKWMGTPDQQDLLDGTALLRIETETQRGTVFDHYWIFSKGKISKLMKMSDKTVYVVQDGRCDCPDASKGNTCKHARSLEVALPLIK